MISNLKNGDPESPSHTFDDPNEFSMHDTSLVNPLGSMELALSKKYFGSSKLSSVSGENLLLHSSWFNT